VGPAMMRCSSFSSRMASRSRTTSPTVKTPTLMVTAHSTSERTLARTRALGLIVVEATCPLRGPLAVLR
jgi:hypothetical protein